MDMDSARFKTSDLPLAAYLLSQGLSLDRVDRSNPTRCQFLFPQAPSVEHALAAWQTGNASVNAIAYWSAIQRLKRLVYRSET